ncbi:MAG: hypothetical protein JNL38_09790 [Myxococcales bacterium]|jgi:hypothetical protein|nr:hypothetical protein [Myxococcales bacterium]
MISARLSTTLTLTLVATLATGCFSPAQIPAVEPTRGIPEVDIEPPPPSDGKTGRVAFDNDGGPVEVDAIVEEGSGAVRATDGHGNWITGGSYGVKTTPICRTPCVTDLPLGTHRVVVGATRVSVTASPKPTVVRVTQPEEDRSPSARLLGTMSMTLGATGVGLGGVALVLEQTSHKSEYRNPGVAAISVGGVLLVTGIVVSYLARGSSRPGGATQFTPKGPAFVVK